MNNYDPKNELPGHFSGISWPYWLMLLAFCAFISWVVAQ